MDTTNETDLSVRYGLCLHPGARTARYTQLAVAKPYRGMNLPLMLILKAHYYFVVPGGFTHTWLLFDAERAASSSLCARLCFSASERAFHSKFGVTRLLVRDERSAFCDQAIRQTQQYLVEVAQKNGRSSHFDYHLPNQDPRIPDTGRKALSWR
jgi:hypothetical protein